MGRSLRNQPVGKLDDARGIFRDDALVRDDDDREPPFLVKRMEGRHDVDARLGVEIPGGLVREQETGAVDQRARNGDALLLSTGELARVMRRPLRKAHRVERRQSTVAAFASRQPLGVVEKRQLDVLDRGCSREQVEALEHEPDLLVPDAGLLVGRELGNVFSREKVLAVRGTVQTTEDMHQSGLARSGRPYDGDELARFDLDRDPAKGLDRDFTERVGLRQLIGADQFPVLSALSSGSNPA